MADVFSFVDETLLTALLRSLLGKLTSLPTYRVVLRRTDYAVIVATLTAPPLVLVLKLAGPNSPVACPFERTAAIVSSVRHQTCVPTFEVVAADVSFREWPWRYLITTHLPGTPWAELRAEIAADASHQAYRDLGRTAAYLHTIGFSAFGDVATDEHTPPSVSLREALGQRATRRVANLQHAALFASVLHDRASLFDGADGPALCHEDLNPNNILLRPAADGSWRLSAILDFESAWAGSPESDLARLELWRGMTGEGFRAAYETVRPIASGYADRRPVFQLLWCLEYASPSPQHVADTARVCAELGIPPITLP